jgi:tRNA-2-methylthio-N6-dimethylallyladenosine synthase
MANATRQKASDFATMDKKLYIKTWGCQMNVYDSYRMADVLAPLGYELVDSPEDVDMMILNTCHIREKATEKVFSELGRLKAHKDAKKEKGGKMLIAVAGCVAQAEGEYIAKRAYYVDMVFGPQTYHELPEMVAEAIGAYGKKRVINLDFPAESKFDTLPGEHKSQGPSAFVSVQEGCDKFCAFCVVPYTRGSEYSRSVTDVMDEVKRLVDFGTVEISLLGQNVNAYHGEGLDGKTWSLADLIAKVADVNGVERIRYTTSHPRDMDDDLIQAHGDIEKLMPFLHLPVQSGSNKILKAMNRKHERELYFEIIDKLRQSRPDMAFSSDFIVGFPGESDQDHEDTMDLIRRVEYASVYSFKYSARPGTPAANATHLVAEPVKKERLMALQALVNEQQFDFNMNSIDMIMPVLLDGKGQRDGQLMGRSPYMQSVHVNAPSRLFGQIVPVRMLTAHANSLSGEIVTEDGIEIAA